MIDDINISSNRGNPAICKKCGKKIRYLAVRGVQEGGVYPMYFCKGCSKSKLEVGEEKLKYMKEEFERLCNLNKKGKEDYLNKVKILTNLK